MLLPPVKRVPTKKRSKLGSDLIYCYLGYHLIIEANKRMKNTESQ